MERDRREGEYISIAAYFKVNGIKIAKPNLEIDFNNTLPRDFIKRLEEQGWLIINRPIIEYRPFDFTILGIREEREGKPKSCSDITIQVLELARQREKRRENGNR